MQDTEFGVGEAFEEYAAAFKVKPFIGAPFHSTLCRW
jgi:hypothetical protein